jgi:ABC-type phosphate transport system substrate-binding protein
MALPDPDRSRVVLIGASRFRDPHLPDLPAVRNNIEGLATFFRDTAQWGLPDARCVIVDNPESTETLVDPVQDAATAAEDTLLIYYAGHGLVHPHTQGLLLAVVGSRMGRTHTAVPYDAVREKLIESPAKRKVVILDCCYSGRAVGGMADPTTAVADEASVEGTWLLASAPPNKQALSPPGETYTAFTGALLKLFTNGVPDGPPLLRIDSIFRDVHAALKRRGRPQPQSRIHNTVGDLTLVRNRWTRDPVRLEPTALSPPPAPSERLDTQDVLSTVASSRPAASPPPTSNPTRPAAPAAATAPVREALPDNVPAARRPAPVDDPPAHHVIVRKPMVKWLSMGLVLAAIATITSILLLHRREPPSWCARGSLTMSGSTVENAAMIKLIGDYQAQCDGATITYQSTGSDAGLKEFQSGGTDVAIVNAPPVGEQLSKADKRCGAGGSVTLPMAINPIAVIYNLDVHGLQLRPATLAKIFSGTLATWRAPEVIADNPFLGQPLPSIPIKPVYRDDPTGSAEVFTTYLATTAKNEWRLDNGNPWPSIAGNGVHDAADMIKMVRENAGAIGFVDLSSAHVDLSTVPGHGLKFAWLVSGDRFVPLSAEHVDMAIKTAAITGIRGLAIDYQPQELYSYPLVMVAYAIVCNQVAADKHDVTKSFLDRLVSRDGQNTLRAMNYTPLPDELQREADKVVRSLS